MGGFSENLLLPRKGDNPETLLLLFHPHSLHIDRRGSLVPTLTALNWKKDLINITKYLWELNRLPNVPAHHPHFHLPYTLHHPIPHQLPGSLRPHVHHLPGPQHPLGDDQARGFQCVLHALREEPSPDNRIIQCKHQLLLFMLTADSRDCRIFPVQGLPFHPSVY